MNEIILKYWRDEVINRFSSAQLLTSLWLLTEITNGEFMERP